MESGDYWALRVAKGFEIYRIGITHSTRCAQIGFQGEDGLRRVRDEIGRRLAVDEARAVELRQRAQPVRASEPEVDGERDSVRERTRA